MNTRLGTTLIVTIGALVAVSGCADVADRPSSSPTADQSEPTTRPPTVPSDPGTAPDVDAEQVARLWGVSYDYAALESPTALADYAETELVIAGRVLDFQPGPIYFAETLDHPEAAPQMVMSVQVDTVVKGDAAPGDTVYVVNDVTEPLEAYSKGLPTGTHVGLYLEDAPVENDNMVIGDEGAGRPAGEQLWIAGPQGFIVADGENDGVVFPYDHDVAPQAEFDEQLPPTEER
ncbi:MAG: hypothetical protein H0U77_06800 [Nocardioidaceae bacterium]|nr:hypothetical protein [Nocardioidaceae bacterium]